MLGYGMVKLFGVQFPFPHIGLLRTPFGDLEPERVLWNFMGSSHLYTNFAGLVEVTSAALLLFRRTTTLGALLAAGALVNVLMLDLSYSVPEKLDVLWFLAISFFLLWPDLPRLASVLLFNQPTPASALPGWAGSPWMNWARNAIKLLVVAYVIVDARVQDTKLSAFHGPPSPLYGIYKVEQFKRNGQIVPPLTTDTNRWSELLFISRRRSWIKTMDDSWSHLNTTFNLDGSSLSFVNEGERQTNHFAYSRIDKGGLTLTGSWCGDRIVVTMKRVDENKLTLLQSQFRWVNGYP